MSVSVAHNPALLSLTPAGLYCEAGDFYIDPWRSVDRAIITHAHSDHARWGMRRYLCAEPGFGVMRQRLGAEAAIDSVPYGEPLRMGSARVSLHPAGHIIGSAQVRIEVGGEVAVVSGDYKVAADPTCQPFEPIRCDTFVSECTFGLPIYRWRPDAEIFAEINAWWARNRAAGRVSLLTGYALGKAQRGLSGVDPSIGNIYCHGAVQAMNRLYREAGVNLPDTRLVSEATNRAELEGALVVAPPSAVGTPWTRRFGDASVAFMSGWMAIRGTRRRRGVEAGFVLSDHTDWPELLETVAATGASRVWLTHGYTETSARYLRELGHWAEVLSTEWQGESDVVEETTLGAEGVA